MADQVTMRARSMVGRMLDPDIQDQFTKRRRAFAEAIGEAAESASGRAANSWRDAEPMRREAARAGREALRWGSRAWSSEMQPSLRRLWSRRAAALGSAGAAVPVARELIDDAAVRLGIRRRREQLHWGAFFTGLLIGAAAGVIAAILTAPKAGREMRGELAGTARDAATRAREVAGRAGEAAATAGKAAATAGKWVPIFQRPAADDRSSGESNGEATEEAAAEAVDVPEATRSAAARKRASNSEPADEVEQQG